MFSKVSTLSIPVIKTAQLNEGVYSWNSSFWTTIVRLIQGEAPPQIKFAGRGLKQLAILLLQRLNLDNLGAKHFSLVGATSMVPHPPPRISGGEWATYSP